MLESLYDVAFYSILERVRPPSFYRFPNSLWGPTGAWYAGVLVRACPQTARAGSLNGLFVQVVIYISMNKTEVAKLGNGTPVLVKQGGKYFLALFHKIVGRLAEVTIRPTEGQVMGKSGVKVPFSAIREVHNEN